MKGIDISAIKLGIAEWETFVNGDLKVLIEKENRQLGGGPEKKPEEPEPEVPDLDFHNKFSSHQAQSQEEKDAQEVQEENDNIGDEDGEPEAVKVTTEQEMDKLASEADVIQKSDEDQKREEKQGIVYEDVTEEIINSEVDRREREEDDKQREVGEEAGATIDYEEVEEKDILPGPKQTFAETPEKHGNEF